MHAPSRTITLLLAVFFIRAASGFSAEKAGSTLPPWKAGFFDIHHINTGRGESSLLIYPDGTTLLIDAASSLDTGPWTTDPKPDGSRPPGEWIGRYIASAIRSCPGGRLNYAMLSHFHWDHMGGVAAGTRASPSGGYQLSGITEVAEHVAIDRIVDRGWPDYNWPVPLDDAKMKNYRRFLDWQRRHRGLTVERINVGSVAQLAPRHAATTFPGFTMRVVSANGWVWSGQGDSAVNRFPSLATLEKADYPRENKCSIGLRASYGRFDYFTGGDSDMGDSETGRETDRWKDIETPIGRAVGPVDVCKANHHGNYDANSVSFIGLLRPRVFVIQTWGASQPAMNVYRHMRSKDIYQGPRDIFITNLKEETKLALHIDRHDTPQGHVVIRVESGGDTYRVFVLDDSNEERRILSVHGPYASR